MVFKDYYKIAFWKYNFLYAPKLLTHKMMINENFPNVRFIFPKMTDDTR